MKKENKPSEREAVLRIPTKQTYAYLEVKVVGTAEEIVEEYLRITDIYNTLQQIHNKQEVSPF